MDKITKDDILNCWEDYFLTYLVEILNREYTVENAEVDIRSLIGSKYDKRSVKI